MQKQQIIRFLFIFFLSSYLVNADGWTQKKGEGYYALDFRYLNATKYHNSTGKNIDIKSVKDLALNFYGEYGINSNITLNVNFPFYKNLSSEILNSNEQKLNNSGIGDVDIGLRYKIKSYSKTVISMSLMLGIPINSNDVYGLDNNFALSDGEINELIGFEIGHSLYPLPVYFSGSVKFNNRNEGFSDNIYVGLESGYNISREFLLNIRFNYLKSLKNGEKKVIENVIPIQVNNQEYLEMKLGGFYKFYNNLGVAATVSFGLYANNILSAPVYSIGFFIN